MAFLAALALLLGLALGGIYSRGRATPRPEYERMVDAAQRFQRATEAVRQERLDRGLPLDPEDILSVGLLGTELSAITTTLGDPAAKRTAQTSDMAALCVRLLTQAGLEPGDRVGACMSGSFPGLNIALICACDAMGLEVVYTASVGASTYGANHCLFTSPEMLVLLWQQGLISTPPASISAGGDDDSGVNMLGWILEEEAAIQSTLERVQGLGIPYVCHPDLADNVAYHAQLYGDIRCFVNVGGTVVGSGSNQVILGLGQGLLTHDDVSYREGSGLVEYYLAQGLPAIHLLNVRRLCLDYGITFDPVQLPQVGHSAVYYGKSYPKVPLAITGLSVVLALLLFGRRSREEAKKQNNQDGKE